MQKSHTCKETIDLTTTLAFSPLLNLVPTQDIAPLLSSFQISVNQNEIDDFELQLDQSDEINEDSTTYKDLIIDASLEFKNFDHDDLKKIDFKIPEFFKLEDSKECDLNLPPLEKKLFEEMDDFELYFKTNENNENNFNTNINTIPFIESDNLNDVELSFKYNIENYIKYKKEYDTVFLRNQIVQTDLLNDKTFTKVDTIKNKKIEEDEENKPKDFINFNDEFTIKIYDELIALIEKIEETKNFEEKNEFWIFVNETKVLKHSALQLIFNLLIQIKNNGIFNQLDSKNLEKIFLFFKNESERDHQTDWDEIFSEMDCEGVFESQESLKKLKNQIENKLGHMIIAKIILIYFNGIEFKKNFDYTSSIKFVIDLVYYFFENLIHPLLVKTHNINLNQIKIKGLFNSLVSELLLILNLIDLYIINHKVTEEFLTKIEYFSILVIFLEINKKNKDNFIDSNQFENLRLSVVNILIKIFTYNEDQRQFILNELLSNLDKFHYQKTIYKPLKLIRGGSIQLTTVLLVRFIEVSSFEKKKNFNFNINVYDEDSLINIYNTSDCFDIFSKMIDVSKSISDHISAFILFKLKKNTNLNHKLSIELLISDLFTLLSLPEWIGSELLINSLTKTFTYFKQTEPSSVLLESYILEFISLIGEKVFDLKKNKQSLSNVKLNFNLNQISFYKNAFDQSIHFLSNQINENRLYFSSINFLALKFINYLKDIFVKTKEINSKSEKEINDNEIKLNLVEPLQFFNELIQVMANHQIDNQNLHCEIDERTTNEKILKIVLFHDFHFMFENILNIIINSINDSKIKIRTKAIKMIKSIVEIDPEVLTFSKIQESISLRLIDVSPLVRDVVIDLINIYINSKPDEISLFYKPICDCINDDSIQVRKKVVKLIKIMCVKVKNEKLKKFMILKLLDKINDEDDVLIDLVNSSLLEIFFQVKSDKLIEDDNILTSTSGIESILNTTDSSQKHLDLLSLFIDENLIKNKDDFILILKSVIQKVINFIVNCSETIENSEIEKAFKLLTILTKSEPSIICQDQLIILQPYIIKEKNSTCLICYYILKMLNNILPNLKSPRPYFFKSIYNYLLQNLTKFNVSELHEAMSCLCTLSLNKDYIFNLANASLSCIKLIKNYMVINNLNQELKFDNRLEKLLHLLGCFSKYFNFEKHRDIFLKSSLDLKENETVVSIMVKFLLYFCNQIFEDKIRNTAIKNVIHACITHPKLFISEPILKVFDFEFESTNLLTISTIILGFFNFFDKQNKCVETNNFATEKTSKKIKIDFDIFYGNSKSYTTDSVLIQIAHRYINKILTLCLIDEGNFACILIKFLLLILKSGFINPKICVPTLIALESSSNPYIRHTAINIHRELFERYESLIETSYSDGFNLAFSYRMKFSKNFLNEKYLFNNLYTMVLNTNTSRKKFNQSLVKLFQINNYDNDSSKVEIQLKNIFFTTLNISNIEFKTLKEVFFYIYSIDDVISRQGLDIYDKLILIENYSSYAEDKLNFVCLLSYTVMTIIDFRNFLINKYSISQNQILDYEIDKIDSDLKVKPKLINQIEFSVSSYKFTSNKDENYFKKVTDDFLLKIKEFL